jgi:hypothetical protein
VTIASWQERERARGRIVVGTSSGRQRADQGLFLLVEGVAEFLVVGDQLLVLLGRAGGGLLLEGAGDAVGEVP